MIKKLKGILKKKYFVMIENFHNKGKQLRQICFPEKLHSKDISLTIYIEMDRNNSMKISIQWHRIFSYIFGVIYGFQLLCLPAM